MSDQGFGQGTPRDNPPPPGGTAPPPPPPPPGLFPEQPATSPPPPPAPQYQQPQAPQQYAPPAGPPPAYGAPQAAAAPKKKRLGLIIGLVVGLIVLCGLGSCFALFMAGSAGGDKATLTQAETHFSAAMSAVATASASLKAAEPNKAAKAVDAADKALRVGRDEIAASRASAERLKDSQGKTDYLAALTKATAALDGLQDLVAYVGTATGMAGRVAEAGTVAKKANDDLNEAISAGNTRSYSKMRTRAHSASAGYAKAAAIFREAHRIDPSAGLDKAAQYAEKRRQQSDIVVQMANEGSNHNISSYNLNIKRMNALSKEAEAIGTPAIVKDPKWIDKRLSTLDKTIIDAGTKTDELRAKALKELGVTK